MAIMAQRNHAADETDGIDGGKLIEYSVKNYDNGFFTNFMQLLQNSIPIIMFDTCSSSYGSLVPDSTFL